MPPSDIKQNKNLIVNADDLGLSIPTNRGIEEAFKKGILTSASLFATTPGFTDAINTVKKNPKLGIGIHLSLTLGKPVSSPGKVPTLVDSDGDFLSSYFSLIIKSYLNPKFIKDAKIELDSQIRKIISVGIAPDHINGQQHFHTIPPLFSIVCKLSNKYKLKLRYPDESFLFFPTLNNLIKFILVRIFLLFDKKPHNYTFFGLLHTGNMNKTIISKILNSIKPGVTEILFHPGFYSTKFKKLFDKQNATHFMSNKNRQVELLTLKDREIMKLIKNNNIILTTYSKV